MTAVPAAPVQPGRDFYVPYFEVRLDGGVVGSDVVRDITQVSYRDSLTAIDSFEMTVNNWDAERRTFKYSDETTFDPGQEIELSMGYRNDVGLTSMIRGEITSLRPTFPAGGRPTLAVSGLNVLHRFRTEQVSYAYEKMTDAQIAQQIGSRLDVEIEVDPSVSENEYDYILQDNQYDIVFLLERARRLGYELFVKEGSKTSLYFGPSDGLSQRTYELQYGRSLIQFQPTLTTANQVGEVTVRGWDAVNKKKIEYTAKRSEVSGAGLGAGEKTIEQSFNKRKEVVAKRPISTEAEARELAIATLKNIARDMVKGSGSIVGLPSLRSGAILMLSGLGERYSGRYFVTSTTHAMGSGGYTTQFQCRKEEAQ